MADFFYRTSNVVLPTGGRIRNNAYVTVTGKGVSLPVDASSHSSTYDPNKTGRPAPILKSVKIELKGEAGCLRYAEVSFTCFDVTSFDNLEKALLIPGSEVTIKYGYVGPETPSDPGEHEFRVYDYSFKITKENYFDCTFKAVGKGGTHDTLEINTNGSFPADTFVSDYRWTNEQIKVTNLFDHLQYLVQLGAMVGKENTSGFNPDHGSSGRLNDPAYEGQRHGYWGVLTAPRGYDSATKLEGGVGTDPRLQYVSLQGIVNAINKYLIGPDLAIIFEPEKSNVKTKFANGRLWSPDPISMLFCYSKGTQENTYHDKLKGKKLMVYPFSADPFFWLGSLAFSDDVQDTPGKILIGRDLLVSIQQSFDNDAKQVKDKTANADKPTGGMPLGKFFKKIFATILENSGGAWDLYLDQDEKDIRRGTISVVNRKCPGNNVEPTPLELDTVGGVNGVRSLSLSAKVPKDTQAKYFAQDTEVEATTKILTQDEQDAADDEKKDNPTLSINQQQKQGRKGLAAAGYDEASISKAKAAVKAMVNAETAAQIAKTNQTADSADMETMPWPIEFELTCDGIEGFQFGDTISSKHLPARYRKKDSSGKIVFTVVSYSHTIAENDWSTTVKALARLR